MEKYDLERELIAWLNGAKKIVVAGVGNELRQDDFVGMKIVKELKGKVTKEINLIECGTIPESYIQEIIELRPTHLLIIDAASFGTLFGSIKLMTELKDIAPAISTHTLPLRIFFQYLKSIINIEVALLAIQPKKTGYGKGLCSEIEDSTNYLVKILTKVFSKKYLKN